MIFSTCPICLNEAALKILQTDEIQIAHIYTCDIHGLFAVSRSLDVELRNLRSPTNVNHAYLLRKFEERVIQKTRSRDGDMARIAMFECLEE